MTTHKERVDLLVYCQQAVIFLKLTDAKVQLAQVNLIKVIQFHQAKEAITTSYQ